LSPLNPSSVNWSEYFPEYYHQDNILKLPDPPKVTIADIGCGFGGLLVSLSGLFPNDLIMGLEIRPQVVASVEKRITQLRKAASHSAITSRDSIGTGGPARYQNISVVLTNIMKFATNYFAKGQLRKMFILYADPHFKKAKYRRRVINHNLLSIYAYIMAEGALLYTITDVLDLYEWTVLHLSNHPLFERVPLESLSTDPCIGLIYDSTEEARKVTREGRNKYAAVFRRVPIQPEYCTINIQLCSTIQSNTLEKPVPEPRPSYLPLAEGVNSDSTPLSSKCS